MKNSLDNMLALLQRIGWSATRIARTSEAAQAELQSLVELAPEEAEKRTPQLVAQLKQQLLQLLQEL